LMVAPHSTIPTKACGRVSDFYISTLPVTSPCVY
jgi:hypothetical protein